LRSRTTRSFRQQLEALPPHIRRQARKAYELFRANPSHPSLHFKQVIGDVYSVRITRGYRALGVKRGDSIVWFWIGSHDEYERMLRAEPGI